jgi:hypothetical protein
MNFDILSSIELTISAAIVISMAALSLKAPGQRLPLVGAFGAWFVWVVGLGASGAITNGGAIGLPGLGVSVAGPIVFLFFWVRRSDRLRSELLDAPMTRLITMNVVRILGVSFLLLYAHGRVSSTFAHTAGWGDILIGLAAWPLAKLVQSRGPSSAPWVYGWNLLGLIDLALAIGLGVTSADGPLHLIHESPGSNIMTTLPWILIPGFLVPLLSCSHLAIFFKLRARAWGAPISSEGSMNIKGAAPAL